MQKIAFAVGDRDLEEYLQAKLKNEFIFVGATVFREGVVRLVGQTNPDIVILRELLEGRENILSVIYDLQVRYPNVRIVFLAGKRDAGDEFLSTLVSYGIYDILHGQEILVPDIIRLIREPNRRADVMYLQPKPTLDSTGKKILFESPDSAAPQRTIVKEVVKEVYVESDITDEELKVRAALDEQKKDAAASLGKPVATEEAISEEELFEEIDEPIIEKQSAKKGFKLPLGRKNEEELPKEDVQNQTPVEPKPVVHKEEKASKGFFSKFMQKDSSPTEMKFDNERMGHVNHSKQQKIITFMGVKGGVGNTSLAFNTAIQLAQKSRVLYVELDEKNPVIPIWYELTRIDKGIETALEGVEFGKIDKIKEAILPMTEAKKIESQMQAEHKKMPDNLDILTFSRKYTLRINNDGGANYDLIRELYLHLLYQLDYNYIILDVASDVFHPITYNALTYSSHVFCTLNQDVATIAKAANDFHELEKQGVDISKKMTLLINRYEKNVIDVKGILEWLHLNEAICVPDASTEFVYANFHGTPFSIHVKNSAWKSVWKTIMKYI